MREQMKNNAFRPYILPLLLVICALFYYFGELVDWAAWDLLRANFFYGVHDIHRLLFLAPIVYAGYTAGIKGAVIITLVSFIIFLPRAFFISPYPDPLLRMVIFVVFAGVIGVLVGSIRNQASQYQRLEIAKIREGDKLHNIIDAMADGMIITDRDYKIRFMNSYMIKHYGDGTGITCYRHLRKSEEPCQPTCKIREVISSGQKQQWQCVFPDGKRYEITAAPYTDTDGTKCQIAIFRDKERIG
jgi:PAS domain-containing protein